MIEVIEGEPIRVRQRKLLPLVRVETHVRRQAFVGAGRLAGRGHGYVHMRPVAIVERSETEERRIEIHDRTGQALSGLLLAACVIPLLFLLAVRLAHKQPAAR